MGLDRLRGPRRDGVPGAGRKTLSVVRCEETNHSCSGTRSRLGFHLPQRLSSRPCDPGRGPMSWQRANGRPALLRSHPKRVRKLPCVARIIRFHAVEKIQIAREEARSKEEEPLQPGRPELESSASGADAAHYLEWVRAGRGGPPARANDAYEGPIVESPLLAFIASAPTKCWRGSSADYPDPKYFPTAAAQASAKSFSLSVNVPAK
jgi:hypothetical protein